MDRKLQGAGIVLWRDGTSCVPWFEAAPEAAFERLRAVDSSGDMRWRWFIAHRNRELFQQKWLDELGEFHQPGGHGSVTPVRWHGQATAAARITLERQAG